MNKLKLVLLAAPICATAWVVACSSDPSSTPGTTTDSGADTSSPPSDSGGDTGQPPQDAGVDSADTGACAPYTGALPKDAGAQCHDVVSNAARITVISDPGTLPVGAGGTLGEGLYYLTEARIYPGSPVPAGTTVKYALLLAGGMAYVVDDNDPAMTVRRTTMKNPDGGAGIVVCESKVDNTPSTSTNTATCGTFTTYDSNALFSAKFVKQ